MRGMSFREALNTCVSAGTYSECSMVKETRAQDVICAKKCRPVQQGSDLPNTSLTMPSHA